LHPGFDEAAIARVDAQRTVCAEDFYRQGVEEFVGEDDGGFVGVNAFGSRGCCP